MTDLRAIPSHSFTGTLKHIATKGYPSALADVFAAMFPRFSDPSDFDWSRVPDIEAVRRNDKVVLTPPVTPRRFGGLQLPRSRYFAVCSDEFGDDGGTLARELDAYKDFARTGPIGLVDMGLQAGRVILGTQFERSREIRTVMLEPERLGLLLTKQSHDSFVAEDGRRLASLLFPYTVSTVTIESVLDLREPQVRAWCVENFSKPNELWMWPESVPELKLEPPEQYESTVHSVPGRAPIPNRFVEMLPTLLNPELGAGGRGGITLQAIAYWLAKNNVNALIYPSARSDAFVDIRNGKQDRFSGWCLVDFRESWYITATFTYVDSNPWFWVALPSGVTVREGEAGTEAEGSLAISGVERRNAIRQVDQADCLRAADQQFGPATPVFTRAEEFSIGTFMLRWLSLALSGAASTDVTFAAKAGRGLLLRRSPAHLSSRLFDDLLDASTRMTDTGDIMIYVRAALKACELLRDALKNEAGQRADTGDILHAGVDLELALITLDGLSRQGQMELSSPVEVPGLQALPLTGTVAAQVDEFIQKVATPGNNVADCIASGVLLQSALERAV